MTQVNTILTDKTGTLIKGVFRVQSVVAEGTEEREPVRLAADLERNSAHPVGKAITDHAGTLDQDTKATDVEEMAGYGLKGMIEGREVLAGNLKLLRKFSTPFPPEAEQVVDTIVVVAIDGKYAGHITIADEIKEDAEQAIKEMHKLSIRTVMLSGDKQSVVDQVAKRIGIDQAYGDLLPEGKVKKMQELKNEGEHIAFAGDGVNDALLLLWQMPALPWGPG